jgi:glycosyltransferase involved in cell wall biosynthesis
LRILIALTYYRPHYSGLTIYVERLARALARRGHQVTVLTSQFDKALPRQEDIDGVQIIRLPVLMRISKGVLMPSMPLHAWQQVREADIVNVHLPQLDAALIASLARVSGKPLVMTYHCDLRLPSGFIHRLANLASSIANWISASMAQVIVTNTWDYAEHSNYLRRYLSKVEIIPPAVELPQVSDELVAAFQRKHHIQQDSIVIGMLARLATEKGVEFLVQAMPHILARYPQAKVLYAGQYQNVLGEEEYYRRLAPLIEKLGEHWQFLGVIPSDELVPFLQSCKVTVLPSLNSTESFGMVQVESMSCGTPSVASDLPGVRQPVLMTGMGLISPPGDAQALAQAIMTVLDNPQAYHRDGGLVREQFSPEAQAIHYEEVFARLAPHAAQAQITLHDQETCLGTPGEANHSSK